jgi:hypothetical protein
VFYWAVFLARGLAGALIAAGVFGAAALRGFFAGRAGSATIFPTMSGLLGWLAQASGDSLCRPTQYPVGLRPHPHRGGSVAGTYGIGVISAGGSNLYGAWGTSGVVTTSGFFPVKNSTIFLNMGVSYEIFITAHFLAKKSD